MFTGIIESIGKIEQIEASGTNLIFTIKSSISPELKVDQSVSHNGVCLTVTQVSDSAHQVAAIQETLQRSNLGKLQPGDLLNLERCMAANGRFDGHIVQGHVDQIGVCTNISSQDGSWLFDFNYDEKSKNFTVEKGSICVNGISLTCFNTSDSGFSVAIIPYTFEHTNMHLLSAGSIVNLEFDIFGKYMAKLFEKHYKPSFIA